MNSVIYYFSATGNSLNVAQLIQKDLPDVELRSIAHVLGKSNKPNIILEDIDRLGFIFPVYAWGMPRIVEDFMKSIKSIKVDYVFAITTCGGTPGKTLLEFNNCLEKKGRSLDCGFAVNEGAYTFLKENVFMNFIPKVATKSPEQFSKRQNEIIDCITRKEKRKIESSGFLANGIGNTLHGFAIKNFKTMDQDFWINDDCNHCGQCVNICPRGNIDIKNGKKIWLNNCEFCFACLQWCPKQAIEYSEESVGELRKHHPDIKIEALL